jgi:hypothetical protein
MQTTTFAALQTAVNAASTAAGIDAVLHDVGTSIASNGRYIRAIGKTAARYSGPQTLRARRKVMAARSARTWHFNQASSKISLIKGEVPLLRTLERIGEELQDADITKHRSLKRLAINLLKQIIDGNLPAALGAEARKEDRMIRLLDTMKGGDGASALDYVLALCQNIWAEEVAAEKNEMRRYFMPTMIEENERLVRVRAGEYIANQSKITLFVIVKDDHDGEPVKVQFTYDAAAQSEEQTKALLEFATTYGLKFYSVEARHAKMVRQTRQMGLITERFESTDGGVLGDDEGVVPKIRKTVSANEWMNNAHPRDARYWYINGTYALEGVEEIGVQYT